MDGISESDGFSRGIMETLEKALSGERITLKEGVLLFDADLTLLGYTADLLRARKAGETVTFIIDRNINFTNSCISRCLFCAYYSDTNTFVLSKEEILKKVSEAVKLGATQILMQGGINPDIGIEYFEDVFTSIRERFPRIHIHSLSPPEIQFLAKREKMSLKEVLLRLKNAGLRSIPGGGAEILVDRVRKIISPSKISSREWLEVMEVAHSIGLPSSATMMFGHIESYEERVEHLRLLRDLQDKTGGFTAFIPWSFQPYNTALYKMRRVNRPAGGVEYLKTLAISRIFLDNFRNIQVSWVSQGLRMAQVALRFGANDFGGTMIEENVLKAAGKSFRPLSVEKIVSSIRDVGRIPAQRDTFYNILRYWDEKDIE
jgi:cyclic dehypoxanthinyl futalosine synthase